MSKTDLRKLAGMLDDPSQSIAVSVMSELLRHEDELMPLLGELQESADPLMRKRVQQLEAILNLRQRRKRFYELLTGETMSVVEGLVELHLLWFDRDNPEMLKQQIYAFVAAADAARIGNIADLGAFMARCRFTLPAEEDAGDPENFCIGPVLEDRIGADVMLCILGMMAGIGAGLQVAVVRVNGKFSLVNAAGVMISPENNWLPDRNCQLRNGEFWYEPAKLLEYASLMLFLFACSYDTFRCVHTIGHALCGSSGNEVLDFLPFPYNGRKTS